jgi:hypothetical protein
MLEGAVFLVDDDPSVRRALTRLIKSAAYHVQDFSSAREFLDSEWRSQGSACLVLDVRMPGLSGLDLRITSHQRKPSDCLHYWPRRHTDERQSNEWRCRGFPAQARQRQRSVARNRASARARSALKTPTPDTRNLPPSPRHWTKVQYTRVPFPR